MPGNENSTEKSPLEQIKILEKKITKLIEEALSHLTVSPQLSLEKAKDALAKDRQITKIRDQILSAPNAPIAPVNLDLMYCVMLTLATCYHACKMYTEALNTYNTIVKNKMFIQAGRLRVNIGNIYMEMGKYGQALKVYRMALDQIPNTNNDLRWAINQSRGKYNGVD